MSGKDRIESVLHTSAIVAACAGAFTAASWGWAKAVNWREKKAHERKLKEEAIKHERDLQNPPDKK